MDNPIKINAQGLSCPLPLLKAKQALHTLEVGQRLMITATDTGSWHDFQAFCQHSGHRLITRYHHHGVYTYMIEKNND